jgi:hypothetical protein
MVGTLASAGDSERGLECVWFSPNRSRLGTAHKPEMLDLRCVRVIKDTFRVLSTAKTHQGSAPAQRE